MARQTSSTDIPTSPRYSQPPSCQGHLFLYKMSPLSTAQQSTGEAPEEPPPPYTEICKPEKVSEAKHNKYGISQILKTVSDGLERLFSSILPPDGSPLPNKELIYNELIAVRHYKWSTHAKYSSTDERHLVPAELNFITYYKDVPNSFLYNAPPLEWPSTADMYPCRGLIKPRGKGPSGVTLWVRYMLGEQRTCSICLMSYWSARCPACGAAKWWSSGYTVIEATHPDLKYLAEFDIKGLRKYYRPK